MIELDSDFDPQDPTHVMITMRQMIDAVDPAVLGRGMQMLSAEEQTILLGLIPAPRSTPAEFEDCTVMQDRRGPGKVWKYSEPGDVWSLIDGRLGPGSVAPWSARSYQALVAEFGPLETPREGGR